MVYVELYGSSDLGSDPSDDEPPSMTSASPSDDDDPEDPKNQSGKKKKKKSNLTYLHTQTKYHSLKLKEIGTNKLSVSSWVSGGGPTTALSKRCLGGFSNTLGLDK